MKQNVVLAENRVIVGLVVVLVVQREKKGQPKLAAWVRQAPQRNQDMARAGAVAPLPNLEERGPCFYRAQARCSGRLTCKTA